jgi:EmrB/QacA subfamily drug resistance transporter
MLFIGLGVALIVMDATIVNVSIPSIITELKITSIDSEWVNSIYSLVFAALLIIFGRLGDRIGRRTVFVAGAVVFAIASILAATTGSGTALIGARAIQGIGGAMMSPSSLSLVNATYPGRRRIIAFAIYGTVIGGMAAVGPLVGGFLTANFSWRWAFGINIPIAAAIIIGSLLIVPDSRDTRHERGFDLPGSLFSAVGIGALVFGLIEGRSYGWWTAAHGAHLLGVTWTAGGISPVAIAFLVAAFGLLGLYLVESGRRRRGLVVLIDVSLFRITSFTFGTIAATILSLGEIGILFSVPLFLQSALGYSALGAGGLLATLALGTFIAGPTTAQLAKRYSPRFVAQLGMFLEVVGILGVAIAISTQVKPWQLIIWLVIYGVGIGYASAQLTSVILADIPVAESGQASGTQSTGRQLGTALGAAVLGTVLFVGLAQGTESRVAAIDGVTAAQAARVATIVEQSAGTAIPSLAAQPHGPAVAAAAREAFAASLKSTAFVAAGFVALGLAATLVLPAGTRRNEEEDDDGEQDAGKPELPDELGVPVA